MAKNPFTNPIPKAGSRKAWQLIDPALRGKLASREWKNPATGNLRSGLFLKADCAYGRETQCLCGRALGYGRLTILDVPGSNNAKFELAHKVCGNREAARRQAEYTARMLAPDAIAAFARASWDFGADAKIAA